MLKSLKISNLILIEKAEVPFGPGLNILTGETGSGKSAILAAIKLISGERAEAGLIREGADFAIIEVELEGPTFIRRELHRSGKNRCFIDDAQVSLTELKTAVGIERIDQSSTHFLCSQEEQRGLLDAFAKIDTSTLSFSEEKRLETELQNLTQIPVTRELEWAQKDLELIEEANWQKGEDELLAQEHHLLTHSQELVEKLGSAASTLDQSVPLFKRLLSTVEQCIRHDAKLTPIGSSLKNAVLELEESHHSLNSYVGRIEANPQRLVEVENRIALIERLKKQFGPDIDAAKEKLRTQIDRLSNIDSSIESLRAALKKIKLQNIAAAEKISQERKKAAPLFAQKVLEEIKSLLLPNAQFIVSIEPKPLSQNGIDEVHFLFTANLGHPPAPLESCASGGELSRVLLALKTTIASDAKCLVFDEIDSNVGGQAATVLGEKLKTLSNHCQVICVTHFVQVARCAFRHFLVSKNEKNGHTFTSVSLLTSQEREEEYNRMLGK